MQCTNRKELTATVTNQKECQENCVQYSQCIGIVYSHKFDLMNKCKVCENENMEAATDGYGFYKNAGNVQGYALTFCYTSRFMTKPIVPLFLYILVSY